MPRRSTSRRPRSQLDEWRGWKIDLKRWTFISYQVRSPQRDLADDGEYVWDGGDLWGTQEAAERAAAIAL
jgi:hypothetical protein